MPLDFALIYLKEKLQEFANVKILNLSRNNLGEGDFHVIIEMLKLLPNCEYLNLKSNYIYESPTLKDEILKFNDIAHLKWINFFSNSFSHVHTCFFKKEKFDMSKFIFIPQNHLHSIFPKMCIEDNNPNLEKWINSHQEFNKLYR